LIGRIATVPRVSEVIQFILIATAVCIATPGNDCWPPLAKASIPDLKRVGYGILLFVGVL
jgi:hypothetical protein